MAFYEHKVLPHLLDWIMRNPSMTAERARFVPLAEGRVLEIGMGSGLNLPFYKAGAVEKLFGLEPNDTSRKLAARRLNDVPFPVEFLGLTAEGIPLEDRSIDTVLSTWTLCTIPDVAKALAEMRRVLKPGGRLIFVEHGKAPDAGVSTWQNRLNGTWGRAFGGCNLNRDILGLVREAGFSIEQVETGYMANHPKILSHLTRGVGTV